MYPLQFISAAEALDTTRSVRAIEDHILLINEGIRKSARNGYRKFNYFSNEAIDLQIYGQILGFLQAKGFKLEFDMDVRKKIIINW